jgi:hypothetical protein
MCHCIIERFTMAIGPISSNTSAQTPVKAAPAEKAEATQGGRDMKTDGDTDDAAAAAAPSSAPSVVVNTLGQQLGRNLNVTA